MKRFFIQSMLLLTSTFAAEVPASPNDALLQAIQRGDRAAIARCLEGGADVNAKDGEGTPVLMNAVLFADAETVRLLLDKGANPNGTNPVGATALLWAAADPAKANLLLDRGAKANIGSALGRTPLLAAAAIRNNGPLAERLIKAGADVNAKDQLAGFPVIYTGGGKAPAIVEAAKARDGVLLRRLIAQGADVNATDHNGGTALSEAVVLENVENVKTLLAAGANVEAKVAMPQYRPLMAAAMRRNPVLVRMLLDAKADVNSRDAFGSTPLMWAAYGAEDTDAAVVRMLLDAGADRTAANKRGETAMTWAKWHGENTAAVRMLSTTSKIAETQLREAVRKALPPLQAVGPVAFKSTGCVSCHAQSFPAMTMAMAKVRGFEVDDKIRDAQRRTVVGVMKPAVEPLLEGSDVVPQIPMSVGMLLMGLAADGYPADKMTAAAVQAAAARQDADGSWNGWSLRPPMSGGDLRETVFAARGIDLYAPAGRRAEFDKRIEAARNWLVRATPASPEEEIVRLLGLHWMRADAAEIRKAAAKVLALQQPDGGWRQLASRPSDAFATGEALVALVESGALTVNDEAYQRGAKFLLETQKADGTWQVATRAYAFQPLSESGFPHGRDQWISATASSWATMALLEGVK